MTRAEIPARNIKAARCLDTARDDGTHNKKQSRISQQNYRENHDVQ
jgi:hypothetical protein